MPCKGKLAKYEHLNLFMVRNVYFKHIDFPIGTKSLRQCMHISGMYVWAMDIPHLFSGILQQT